MQNYPLVNNAHIKAKTKPKTNLVSVNEEMQGKIEHKNTLTK